MKTTITTIGLLLSALIAFAQDPLVNVQNADKCIITDTVYVDIVGQDFDDIIAFEFSLGWDPSELEYVDVKNKHASLSSLNLNETLVSSGNLGVFWTEANNDPVSIGNSVLFSVGFVVANINSNSTISFSDSPRQPIFIKSAEFGILQGLNGDMLGCLPLEFTQFSASLTQNLNSVKLSWETAYESNIEKYEVQRMMVRDGVFKPLGFVNSQGMASDYEFMDESPAFGDNYYRIKIIELDNKISYSSVQHVKRVLEDMPIYPNPAASTINVNIEAPFEYQIIDINGKIVQQAVAASSVLDISQLSVGMYMLKLIDASTAEPKYKKFIKK